MTKITKPGIYDLPAETYHADPVEGGSLSSSGARFLLDTCPARFRHALDNPTPSTPTQDFGSVAHRMLLGRGDAYRILDFNDYKTKAAQTARDEAAAAGLIPILEKDADKARAMVAALRAHPFAGACFAHGLPERTLVWRADDDFGVMCRAMLDMLPARGTVWADYKTCRSAEPEFLRKQMADYGYHQQAAWYLDGVMALGLCAQPSFVFVFQEKEPPYLVTVMQPDADAIGWGRIQNRKARALYAACARDGVWPGYADDVLSLALPEWMERRFQHAHEAGAYETSMAYHKPLDAAE